MVDALLRWSLSHRLAVLVLAAVLFVWGTYVSLRMPVDVLPDLTAPTVTVITEGRGMAPEELESRVTFPIETAINGTPGVRRVRSATGIGISIVHADFGWDVDVYRARQTVSEKLQLVRDVLPDEVKTPVLAPTSSVMGEITFLAVTVHGPATLMDARTFADFTLRRRLLAIPGVSQVVVTGGERKQFQVALHPERLLAHAVTVGEVLTAIEATNTSVSAGFIEENGQEFLVHGLGRVRTPEDVAETFVATRGETPVLVRHLGEVLIGAALRRGQGSYGAMPAVIVGIQKQPGANTLALTARIDAELDAMMQSLPPGISLHRDAFRQATFIEVAVRNVLRVMRDGVILVLVVVILFLGSGRASAVTIVAIPLSIVAAILALSWAGATLNTMTLGGIAIAVGELVDDAIIDVENVVRRLRLNARRSEGERCSGLEVVRAASIEIRSSIVFATLAVVLVFLPLFFLDGVEGRLLAPLATAYVVSLLASLLVAITVTPVLCSLVLPRARAITEQDHSWLGARMERLYAPILDVAIRRWFAVAVGSLAAFALAITALSATGQSFLPEFREGALTVAVVTLPGTSLEQSDAIGHRVEEMLLAQPEVLSVARRTGRAELDEHAQGVNASELDVMLRPEGQGRTREELQAALRDEFAQLPGTNITIGQPIGHRIDHILSGTRASIAVKIFGDELSELRRSAIAVETVMRAVPGVVDLTREQQADVPHLRVRFDREAIAAHGLHVADVARALQVTTGAYVVSEVMDGRAIFELAVRTARASTPLVDELPDVLVLAPSGARIPLRVLADIRRDRAPSEIGRENVQRRVVVSCNVASRDVVSVVHEVQAAVGRLVTLPADQRIVYSGQFESAESSTLRILLLACISILGIFVLLHGAFGSARDAALVMSNLPLALIGGVAGVWALGGVISVASLVGFVTLFGIAARNGIMLVAHIRHLVLVEGVTDPDQAVRRAARERVVPITMTALAAGLGLLPLALAAGEPGSEIQAPMAVVILCGLISSTALNMFVVPALYRRFGAVLQAPATGPVAVSPAV